MPASGRLASCLFSAATEVGRIAKLADAKTALDRQGMMAQTGTPEQFAHLIARTIEQTAKLVKLAGLKLE